MNEALVSIVRKGQKKGMHQRFYMVNFSVLSEVISNTFMNRRQIVLRLHELYGT